MGLFDFLRRAPRVETKAITDTVDKSYTGGNGLNTFYAPPSALLTALNINASSSQLIGDPRLKMETYMTMAVVFPEVSRMLQYHIDIMGCPRIESDDETWADEMNAVLAELYWRGQLTFEGNKKRGLDAMISQMAYNTLVCGQSFYSILDAQGLPVLSSRQKVDALQLHSSSRFTYNNIYQDRYELSYQNGTTLELDKRITPAFQSVRFCDHPEYAWGKPLLYDAERVAMEAAIFMESQLGIYRQIGAATRMTVISMEPVLASEANAANAVIGERMAREWGAKADELRKAYESQMAHSSRSGKATDIVAAMIGKMNVATHSAADSINPISTYPSDIKQALSRIVVAMLGDPDLVGLPSTGGDGIGSVRSEMKMDSMRMFAQSLRKSLNPHVRGIVDMASARLSKRIPKYELEWEGLSTAELKSIADREQVEATTQKTYVDALMSMVGVGELTAAKAFAIENDLDWFAMESGTL